MIQTRRLLWKSRGSEFGQRSAPKLVLSRERQNRNVAGVKRLKGGRRQDLRPHQLASSRDCRARKRPAASQEYDVTGNHPGPLGAGLLVLSEPADCGPPRPGFGGAPNVVSCCRPPSSNVIVTSRLFAKPTPHSRRFLPKYAGNAKALGKGRPAIDSERAARGLGARRVGCGIRRHRHEPTLHAQDGARFHRPAS